MKSTMIFLTCALLVGCANPAGRVNVAQTQAVASPNLSGRVETYDTGQAPEKPYQAVATLSFRGTPADFYAALEDFKIKTRELGADALMMQAPQRISRSNMEFRAVAIEYL